MNTRLKMLSFAVLASMILLAGPAAAQFQNLDQIQVALVSITHQSVCTADVCETVVAPRKEIRITGNDKAYAYLVFVLLPGNKLEKHVVMREDTDMWNGIAKKTCTTFRLPEDAVKYWVLALTVDGPVIDGVVQ